MGKGLLLGERTPKLFTTSSKELKNLTHKVQELFQEYEARGRVGSEGYTMLQAPCGAQLRKHWLLALGADENQSGPTTLAIRLPPPAPEFIFPLTAAR